MNTRTTHIAAVGMMILSFVAGMAVGRSSRPGDFDQGNVRRLAVLLRKEARDLRRRFPEHADDVVALQRCARDIFILADELHKFVEADDDRDF